MKTLNRILKFVSKSTILLVLFLIGFIFTTCKDNNDENVIYYYDVYGEGYVPIFRLKSLK